MEYWERWARVGAGVVSMAEVVAVCAAGEIGMVGVSMLSFRVPLWVYKKK